MLVDTEQRWRSLRAPLVVFFGGSRRLVRHVQIGRGRIEEHLGVTAKAAQQVPADELSRVNDGSSSGLGIKRGEKVAL